MSKTILILSDLHFSRENSPLFDKFDVEKNFDLLLSDIDYKLIDYVFLLGDISQDGSIESYIKIQNKLSSFNCNTYIIMGNHDSYNIRHILSSKIYMSDYLDIDNSRFIFLSSFKNEKTDSGYLSENEFNKIKLLYSNKKNNFLLVHHHFIVTNAIIDGSILENNVEFVQFIEKYDFKAIFHGHVHNGYKLKLNNTDIIAAPATCVQFALKQDLVLEHRIGLQYLVLKESSYTHEFYFKII